MSEFIFTTHARERLQQRNIPLSDAESVLRNPDKTYPGKKPNTVKFIRTINYRRVELIATHLSDQKKWLVVSAWVRGEDDKVPLSWQIIALPFRLVWWVVKKIVSKTAGII